MNTLRKLWVPGLLAVVALGSSAQQTQLKKEQAPSTAANSGSEMYMNYCASCHGKDAKGNGPAAAALKTAPPDLTGLAKRNWGHYPTERVDSILRGKEILVSHGSEDMPVWGPVFRSVSGGHEGVVDLRVTNLNTYLASLQAK